MFIAAPFGLIAATKATPSANEKREKPKTLKAGVLRVIDVTSVSFYSSCTRLSLCRSRVTQPYHLFVHRLDTSLLRRVFLPQPAAAQRYRLHASLSSP